jgi:hypothetical protein
MIRNPDKSTLDNEVQMAPFDNAFDSADAEASLEVADRHIAAAIDAYEKERKQLIRQIEPITRKITAIEDKIAKLRMAHTPTVSRFSEVHAPKYGERLRRRPESLAWKVREQAYAILKKAGRPMSRIELLEELKAGGIEVGTTNPPKSIGRIMWNADEFEYVDNGYWIKGEALPKDYRPGKRYRRDTLK